MSSTVYRLDQNTQVEEPVQRQEPVSPAPQPQQVQHQPVQPQPQQQVHQIQPQQTQVIQANVGTQPIPEVNFGKVAKDTMTTSSAKSSSEKIDATLDILYQQAVVHTVAGDEEVQRDIMDTAKKVVTDKADALRNQAEKESKIAYFENNESACACFGYDEKTTHKSHVKIMAFWIYVLNTIYIFTLGFFVVSPICFILKKLKVVIKQTWLALLIALLIYVLIIASPFIAQKIQGLLA